MPLPRLKILPADFARPAKGPLPPELIDLTVTRKPNKQFTVHAYELNATPVGPVLLGRRLHRMDRTTIQRGAHMADSTDPHVTLRVDYLIGGAATPPAVPGNPAPPPIPDRREIGQIHTVASRRGLGLGEAAMRRALAIIHGRGESAVLTVASNNPAAASQFYARLGFRQLTPAEHAFYLAAGLDAANMWVY
ncbi:GNAT family N-acetyltransferase [Deinococcus soli (ex Cha et al. 2016)]|uniref:Ribosomal protein S18 acetylase RimI-like enzyme n=2 Tax=Deinococcus soli (ex Cha et al. 2016) TaxID=1309411 RepID=A0ACC6KKM8_9DEIO|nr:GNAT family N-acetyltransferase [Deinococcus soli (ex Cha et al. 2016)]MDR6218730.1 ribosomal protein S18 acetylase RimI-like enzyme [Deinococcus soli (ex Cha et al. 2016)]MDR6328527.1 ribosomal protein S18 acetylase RimI-like enzyme [Deinococcus soli (ex Cha et al. 2016)]MDR6753138.1 ribosomal protein S18 acetylase RimI-like enzyme [Deinococcus soli (ex Cha et al. 2016)]